MLFMSLSQPPTNSEDQANYYNTITNMDETVGQIRELMVSATTKCFDLPVTMDLIANNGPGNAAGLRGHKSTLC